MKMIFHKKANEELLKARDYYDKIIFGLGKQFIIEIENSLNKIKVSPFLYQLYLKEIRKCNTKTFPFSIYYDINDKYIRILAIAHQKRKPDYWKNRL